MVRHVKRMVTPYNRFVVVQTANDVGDTANGGGGF